MRAQVLVGRTDEEGDVAELLAIFGLCKEFNVLPRAGGLLDQPARTVYLLSQVSSAYAEKESKDTARKNREAKKGARNR